MDTLERFQAEGTLVHDDRPAWPSRAAGLHAETLRTGLVLFALLTVWAFCNPFFGTDRGGLIYSARALADLDPDGIGRDIMFRFDGQSSFTVFTIGLRTLTRLVGASSVTMLISAAAVLTGFCGAVAMAATAATGPARILALVFAATLPTDYGGFRLFSYAEAAATPRPFAEALVLCALAALVCRRTIPAVLLIGAALVVHPIMALPGLVIIAIWSAIEDRRWLIVWLAVAVCGIGAVALGLAPFDRVGAVVDPEWRGILAARNPHLFPSLWPDGWIGRDAARTATLLVAATIVPNPVRRLFLLSLGVGALGLAAGYWLAGSLGSLAIVQAQTWRMMWIVYALASTAAAVCVLDLWPRGGTARIVLILLALVWIYADSDLFAVVFGIAAVGLHRRLRPESYPVSPALLRCALVILGGLGLMGLVQTQFAFHDLFAAAPAALKNDARRTIATLYDYMPLAIVAAIVSLLPLPRLSTPILAVVAATGALVVVGCWDQRSAADVGFDSGQGAPALERIVAGRPGEIYWIDGGRETWSWLHRPQWLSAVQGAGLVFSRDLALVYQARANRAIAYGLADDDILTPLTEPHEAHIPTLAPAAVAAFCALPNAPAWIVAPLVGTTPLPAGVAGTEWIAPTEKLEPLERGHGIVWERLSRYAVVPCAR